MDGAFPAQTADKLAVKPHQGWTHYRLLASIPLRRRTLRRPTGNQLVRSGRGCSKFSGGGRYSSGRSTIPLPELSRGASHLQNQIRSRTAGADTHDYLWASSRGRPLRGQLIYNAVRRRTRKALGFPINLHRFRLAAATFWSMQDPANVRGAKDLLGHASFATTEKYYIMAQSRLAGRALARAIDALRADLGSS